jgi:hypothetical protein
MAPCKRDSWGSGSSVQRRKIVAILRICNETMHRKLSAMLPEPPGEAVNVF